MLSRCSMCIGDMHGNTDTIHNNNAAEQATRKKTLDIPTS